MEVVVPKYAVTSPDILEAMVEITELLDKVARGELAISEARAMYVERILPKLKELEEKYTPKKKASSGKKSKKTSKRSKKTSSRKSKKRSKKT